MSQEVRGQRGSARVRLGPIEPVFYHASPFCALLAPVTRIAKSEQWDLPFLEDDRLSACRCAGYRSRVSARGSASSRRTRRKSRQAAGNRQIVVNSSHWQNTYRASRPVNHLDILRKNVFNAEAINRVSIPAANFHDSVVAVWVS
jgi:hypothetical protein